MWVDGTGRRIEHLGRHCGGDVLVGQLLERRCLASVVQSQDKNPSLLVGLFQLAQQSEKPHLSLSSTSMHVLCCKLCLPIASKLGRV